MVAQIPLPEPEIDGVRVRWDEVRHRSVSEAGGKSWSVMRQIGDAEKYANQRVLQLLSFISCSPGLKEC